MVLDSCIGLFSRGQKQKLLVRHSKLWVLGISGGSVGAWGRPAQGPSWVGGPQSLRQMIVDTAGQESCMQFTSRKRIVSDPPKACQLVFNRIFGLTIGIACCLARWSFVIVVCKLSLAGLVVYSWFIYLKYEKSSCLAQSEQVLFLCCVLTNHMTSWLYQQRIQVTSHFTEVHLCTYLVFIWFELVVALGLYRIKTQNDQVMMKWISALYFVNWSKQSKKCSLQCLRTALFLHHQHESYSAALTS